MDTQTESMNNLHYGTTVTDYNLKKHYKLVHFWILLTHDHILAHTVHIRLVPGGQSVNRYEVGLELAVWVGEDSLQPGDELCGAALVRTQEKPFRVIVIGVKIVPDHGGSS